MTSPSFCRGCAEGLWLSLLRRVDLTDDVVTSCSVDAGAGTASLTADLHLVPLAGLRTEPVAPRESCTILWTKGGSPLPRFAIRTRLVVDGADTGAVHAVGVTFTTEEVRVDKEGLLSSHRDIALLEHCRK